MNIQTARQLVIADQRQGYSEEEATEEELIQYVKETITEEMLDGDGELVEAYIIIINS